MVERMTEIQKQLSNACLFHSILSGGCGFSLLHISALNGAPWRVRSNMRSR
jgi:hypothetical protein